MPYGVLFLPALCLPLHAMSSPTTVVSKRVYGLQFWLLCLSTFLFFTSFNMIIPELPAYLTSIGGEDYKGLIISLFTLTAGISRPFSGKLADTIGRIPVMVFGFRGVCCLCYPLPFFRYCLGFLFAKTHTRVFYRVSTHRNFSLYCRFSTLSP